MSDSSDIRPFQSVPVALILFTLFLYKPTAAQMHCTDGYDNNAFTTINYCCQSLCYYSWIYYRMGLKQNVNHGVLIDCQSFSVINSSIIHFANQWHLQYYCCKILNENLCLQTNYSMNTFNSSHPYIYIQRMKGYNLSCSTYLFKEPKSLFLYFYSTL